MKGQAQIAAAGRPHRLLLAALGLLLLHALSAPAARAAGAAPAPRPAQTSSKAGSPPPKALEGFDCSWQLPPFSEEFAGRQFCPGAIRAVRCEGDYCDNLSLDCCSTPAVPRSNDYYTSPFFSEDSLASFHICQDGRYVRGVYCQGDYCDDLSLHCEGPGIVNTNACRWTGEFSEEGTGIGSCNGDEVVAGIACTGSYCDNLNLYCCKTN